MIKKYLGRIIIGFCITGFFLLYNKNLIDLKLVDRLELLSYDARLIATLPEEQLDPRIVIIDIDEASLKAEGHWPWNRVKLAQLVGNLMDVYKLEILGFDVVFAERDSSEEMELLEDLARQTDDTEFLQRFEDYKPFLNPDQVFASELQGRAVILGYFFDKDKKLNTFTGELVEPVFPKGTPYYDMLHLEEHTYPDGSGGTVLRESQVTGYAANVSELQQNALTSGYFSIPSQDADGILRRIQLLEKYNGAIYESLPLSLARNFIGSDIELLKTLDGEGREAIDGLDIGTGLVPMDTAGTTYIPYRGLKNIFRYISATDVLNLSVENPEDLEYTIGIVGTTAAGLVDLRNTPLKNNFPGVEIIATTIAGLIDAEFHSTPYYSFAIEFILILITGLILSLLFPFLGATGQTLSWLIASALLVAGNLYLWTSHLTILALAPVLLMTFALYILNVAYGYFFESRNKAKLSGLFGQYIPPELVDEMAKDPDSYNLEAKKQELTVMFSDVRGFTSISEGLDPKALSALMNELLSPMTRIVHDNKGTIDKYMGDAMMAFWGAPIDDPQHASKAVHSGLQMLKELETVNQSFAAKDWPLVKIGIGLNTGEMNVGNMGSEFRMAYTVLGDAVNLGSRVEGLTKAYGVDFIVTEYTAAATPEYAYRYLDSVKVKGKEEPVTIFEPMGLIDSLDPQDLQERDQYDQAIKLYNDRDFSGALALLTEINSTFGERFLHNVYRERCQHFIDQPPPDDWDGVFTFTTK